MAEQKSAKYKRILLKLSGEALMGDMDFGIDPKVLDRMALEVGQLRGIGVQVGLVMGGGNLFRGKGLSEAGQYADPRYVRNSNEWRGGSLRPSQCYPGAGNW